MTIVPTAKRLTILEGPDGSGKSTLAKLIAKEQGARYVHCGPLQQSTKSLARYYAEAMWPALMGYEDIVMDRCWLSEEPYGKAFRQGANRIGPVNKRMLERLAARAATLVVLCMPPWEKVAANYTARKRRNGEMLDNINQLRHVYDVYNTTSTVLPMHGFDYTWHSVDIFEMPRGPGIKSNPPVDTYRSVAHWQQHSTSGFVHNDVTVLVSELPPHKNGEMWWRFPGVSFRPDSDEWWLTERMIEAGIHDQDLLWVSAEDTDMTYLRYMAQDLSLDSHLRRTWRFVALGAMASNALHRLTIKHETYDTPGFWRSTQPGKDYPLLEKLS